MAERTLTVKIVGDDADLRRAFASSEKSARSFQGSVTGIGAGVSRDFLKAGIAAGATAVSFQAVTQAIGNSVATASDLNEQISKSRQIFGDSSREIEAWSQETARSFGIARNEALSAAGTFGNLFRVVELAPAQAADMSRALVQLAADLASFNNADPTEVLVALRSGLIGEAEPLRRYGVLLSEARVQQEAMEATGKRNVKALTDQEKALARYNIILQDTAPAQGDFARTSEGLANQSRVLRAQLTDLSANIGEVLIPVLTDAAQGANALFQALDQFRGIDFSPKFDFPDIEFGRGLGRNLLLGPALGPLTGLLQAIQEEEKAAEEAERALGPGGGIGEHIAEIEEERAREAEQAQRRAKRAQDRQRRAFDAFVKGMGLKLDKAQLTETLDDDIAALRELERAILRQIEREGRTFKLVEQLTEVRLQIQSLVAQRAEEAAQEARDAFQQVLDALDLKLNRAQVTASLEDDLRVLREMENVLTRRIAAEGKTLELERELFDVRQQQAEVRRQQAERQRERREGKQFEALGLTAEGEERIPSTDALQRRLQSLREQIKGTVLDTQDTRSQLQRIARVLSGDFGKVGRDVRQAILEMFREISGALEEGGKTGPLTKTTGLNTRKLLAGLGLSPEEIRALRGRLSNFNSAGVGFAVGPPSNVPITGFGGGQGGALIVENNVTVEIGDQKIAAVVTKQQQKTKRRNPKQKRGSNRNR